MLVAVAEERCLGELLDNRPAVFLPGGLSNLEAGAFIAPVGDGFLQNLDFFFLQSGLANVSEDSGFLFHPVAVELWIGLKTKGMFGQRPRDGVFIDDYRPFAEVFGEERQAAVSREISKVYEETIRGSVKEIISHFQSNPIKGEFVIILSGC